MVRTPAVLTAVACVLLAAACSGDAATPVGTAEPVASPSPSSSPTAGGSPAPLTGELLTDPAAVERPALAVKVENTEKARPQAGLEDADLVIEELVEGGVTRFVAVFQSTVPDQVGPIRSARLVDAELLPAFDGAFLYSGGRPEVQAAIDGTALLLADGTPGVERDPDRTAPSNLVADGATVYDEVADRDPSLGPPPSGFVFDEDPPADACDVCDGSELAISMSPAATAGWTHDEAAGVYRRDQDGVPQPTVSGDDVGAANVVAVAVTTEEGGCCDTAGAPYVVSRTTGDGRAVVLRDGRWYEATWERPSAEDPWRIVVDGADLPLAPGPTWLHLVPGERMPPTPDVQSSAAEDEPTDTD